MPENLVAEATVVVAAPVDAVWRALVTPAAIREYMFGAEVASDWHVGSPITWTGEFKGQPYQDRGSIRRVDPGQTLEYTHYSPMSGQPDAPEHYHTITINLVSSGDSTTVRLRQDGNATAAARDESASNWSAMLAGLKRYVEHSPH